MLKPTPEEVNYMIIQENPKITQALESYESKGQKAAKEIKIRSLKDLNKKKEATQGQFFTPAPIAAFITKLLHLDESFTKYDETRVRVMDNSCGIGKLLRFVNPDHTVYGTDIDTDAIDYAAEVFKDRENWHFRSANLALTQFSEFDVALLNPPFNISIQTNAKIPFESAMWGKNGPNTVIWSHIAAIESAVKADTSIIAIILPENAFKNERDWAIDKVLKNYTRVYYAKFGKTFFAAEGASVEPILAVYIKNENKEEIPVSPIYRIDEDEVAETLRKNITPLAYIQEKFEKANSPVYIKDKATLEEELNKLYIQSQYFKHVIRKKRSFFPPKIDTHEITFVPQEAKPVFIPIYAKQPVVTMHVKNSSEVVFKGNSVYTNILLEAERQRMPLIDYYGKDPEQKGNTREWRRFNALDFARRIAIQKRIPAVQRTFDTYVRTISLFAKVKETQELKALLKRRENQYARESKYFEKWTYASEAPNARLMNGKDIALNVEIENYTYTEYDYYAEREVQKNYLRVFTTDTDEKRTLIEHISIPTNIDHINFPITCKLSLHLKKDNISDDGTVTYKISTPDKQIRQNKDELIKAGIDEKDAEEIALKISRGYFNEINSKVLQQIFNETYSQEKKWVYDDSNGITDAFRNLYEHIEKEVEKTEIPLWDFQKKDVIRALMKPNAIIGDVMGLGKTRMLLTIAAVMKQRGAKRVLIITEEKLISGYFKEVKKIDYKYKLVKVKKASDIPKDLSNVVMITSYTKIWRDTKDTGKPLWKHLEKVNTLLIDELQNLKSPTTNQTAAIRRIKAKRKILASGTPIKNYPYNFFSPMAIAFGENTFINPYSYRGYIPIESQNGDISILAARQYFINNFVIIAEYNERFKQTLDSGKKRRRYPGIKDIEEWEKLVRKMIIRRVKNEPEVQKEIKFPMPTIKKFEVDPDPYHKEYYAEFVQRFAEWMREHIQAEIDDQRKMSVLEILMQLITLQFASTIPQHFINDDTIPYRGPKFTAKQKKVIEIVKKHYKIGEKIIVFSEKPEFCNYMAEQTKNEFENIVFTGEIPNKRREELLEQFKTHQGAMVMWATTKTGGTGLNIPQANIVVIADRSWVPGDHIQAYSRILRPEQNKDPIVYFVENKGFIDEYMKQLEMYKISAINEGIDGQIDTADISKYISYRDFAISMLQDLNLIDLAELEKYIKEV